LSLSWHAVSEQGQDESPRAPQSLALVSFEAPEDFDVAFATMARERIDALFIVGEPMIGAQRKRIAELALDHHMPAVSPFELAR
jgi:hypothetical protein